MTRTIRLVAGALAAVFVASCQTVRTTEPGVIGVDRPQSMSPLLSEEELRAGAASAYRRLLQEANAKGRLNTDAHTVEQVRAIGTRLIATTRVFRSDAPGWPWEMNVLGASEVNAWCMPGGKIALYTGLIDKLRPTNAELAAVIGHEIAHALREHVRERASRAVTQGLLIDIVGTAAGTRTGTIDFAKLALEVTLNLPNSREQEDEADRIGVELAARAGYDPRAAVTLWEKMTKLGGGAPPEWLSTHPAAEARIRSVAEYAQRVLPLYEGGKR
jgi:predicted Zn-dependent protease